MRTTILLACVLLAIGQGNLYAQGPVHWNYSITNGPAGKQLRIVAQIDQSWHIYAQVQPKEAISIPTKIVFTPNPLVQFTGPLVEKGEKMTYTDRTAGIIQYQYADSVVYTRPLKLRGLVKTTISGTITYQSCTSEYCLPEETITFSIPLQ